MSHVSKKAIRLCLDLLEAKVLRYTHAALTDFHGAIGEELIRAGLLIHQGHDAAVGAEDDDEGRPVRVSTKSGSSGLGYASPSQGWVAVDQSSLRLYRPDLDQLFSFLLGPGLRPAAGGVRRLDDTSFVWEIGSIRLSNSKLISVWFARRLTDQSARERLRKAAEDRPTRDLRILLTSTPRRRLPDNIPHNSAVVPIDDVLSMHNPSSIDINILRARLDGRGPAPITSNLHLSDDGTVLTINRTIEIRFRGDIQIAIIRKLVTAHQAARWVNAAKVLESSGSACRMFSQVFKRQWPELRKYLISHDGLWKFEL